MRSRSAPRRPFRLTLRAWSGSRTFGLCCALALTPALGISAARADDWQVSRSPFDARLVQSLKAQLLKNPEDAGALRRLLDLYRRYRTLEKLSEELAERTRGGDPNALVLSGHVARERGRLDEAAGRYREAREHLSSGSAGVDRPGLSLLLADLALRRVPPETTAALQELDTALGALRPDDARRPKVLRRAADLALRQGDLPTARRHYQALLARASSSEAVTLHKELAEALSQQRDAALRREALAEWQKVEAALRPGDPARAEAALRVGELQEESASEELSGANPSVVVPPAANPPGPPRGAAEALQRAAASYRRGLSDLPPAHPLRRDLYEHLIGVYRRQGDLRGAAATLSAEWPERRRGFTENDLLGRVHDELGDTDQALSSYRAALSQNPHATDVRRRMIAVLERAGQTAAVLREYQRLSSDAPGEPRYYLELAERQERAGQRSAALQTLRRAAERFPGDPSLHGALLDLYQRFGEVELALREAELLVRIEPRDEAHIVDLGEIHWARGQRERADEIWKRLLQTGESRAAGQARLADVYAEHNLLGQALELYQRALRGEPQNLTLKRGLALAYERMNRPRDALPLWEQVYFATVPPPPKAAPEALDPALPPGTPAAPEPPKAAANGPHGRSASDAAKSAGQRALHLEARQHLASMLGKDPRFQISLHGWRRRYEDLLQSARRLTTAPPPDLLATGLLLAEAHLRLNRISDAELTLRGLAELTTLGRAQRGEVLLGLAPIYRQQRKLPEAIAVLKQALALLPERARELYAQLAELSLQSYHDDEAVIYAQRAITDSNGELRLAELLERKDDIPRALLSYRRALQGDDRQLRAHLGLARLLLREGQFAEAAALYREVVRRSAKEEQVLEAGRKAIDLHEYLGTLAVLYQDLAPLPSTSPGKPVYRRLLGELLTRYGLPLGERARAGDAVAQGELARLGQSALKPLTEALIEGDPGEQRAAVALLGALGNPAAAPALLRLAVSGKGEAEAHRDEGPAPRADRRPASSDTDGRGARAALTSDDKARRPGDAVARMTPAARSGLFGLLARAVGQADMDLRVDAALAAARLADPRSVATLGRLAHSEEKQLRLAGLYGLARLAGGPQSAGAPRAAEVSVSEPLLRALLEGPPEVQTLAALGLGQLGEPGPRARAQLLQCLQRAAAKDEPREQQVALACAHALGQLQAREPAVLDALLPMLQRGDEQQGRQAVAALASQAKVGRVRAALLRAMFEGGPLVREAALRVLLADAPARDGKARAPLPDPERGLDGLDLRSLLARLPDTLLPPPSAEASAARLALLRSLEPGSDDARGGSPSESPERAALRDALWAALLGPLPRSLRTLLDLQDAPAGLPIGLGPLTAGLGGETDTAGLPGLRALAAELLEPLRRLALATPNGEPGPESAQRVLALRVLGQLARAAAPLREEVKAVVLRAAQEETRDPDVQVEALAVLARLDSDQALAIAARLLQSPDPRLRLCALRSAAAPRLPEPALQRAAQDRDGFVREAALALGNRGAAAAPAIKSQRR